MPSVRLELALELKERVDDLIHAINSSKDEKNDPSVLEAFARQRNAVRELERHVIQPPELLFQLAVSQQLLVCVHWLCYFKVIFSVPTDEENSISYPELATKSNVALTTLKSVARMAMISGFLRETTCGQVQHTSLSAAFATDPDTYNWIMYLAKETAPTVAAFVKATERWPNSQDKTQTAYSFSRGTDLSFFDHINLSEERANEFGAYMKSQASSQKGTSVNLLRDGFDWASVGAGNVVDVGGGGGDASIALAEKFSRLTFVVQDLPASIATARKRAQALPTDISERVVFQEHDFFHTQAVNSAAVYLLRMVLHDWPHDDCVKILTPLVSAMGAESRIVVMDMVLPRPGSTLLEHEAVLRQKDLVMKQNFNAKERELEEWRALVGEVGLAIAAVKTPRGSQHSVLELVKIE